MAYIDDVTDQLAVNITNILAPFQPSIPPDYVNNAPSAGYIPATIIGSGHPIQVKVLNRLENHMSQVSIYPYRTEKVMPYFDSKRLVTLPGGLETYQTGRSEKAIIIEVWSYDRPSRATIANVIRGYLGDFYRQTELDSTTTSLRYMNTQLFDDEQSDSVYVTQLYYNADYDILQIPVEPFAYPVTTVDVYAETNQVLLGLVKQQKGS